MYVRCHKMPVLRKESKVGWEEFLWNMHVYVYVRVPTAWEVLLLELAGCSCDRIHEEKRNYVLQPIWVTEFLVLMFTVGVKDV